MGESKAYVVFSGKTELFWVRLLKRGFKHCYILINDGDHWISLDPLASHTELTVHALPAEFDLPEWIRGQGQIVMQARIRERSTAAPLGLVSCVEVIKRMLGIHNILIVTPWQLYLHLLSQKGDI